jgi:hypothetical protein
MFNLVLYFLAGCATRYGRFSDGKEYAEYDINFDQENAKFSVPFDWRKEPKTDNTLNKFYIDSSPNLQNNEYDNE